MQFSLIDDSIFAGKLISDLPITAQRAFGGKLDGGGPLLTLRTSAGDIRLRSR